MAKDKETKKVKRPTAQKRKIQSDKQNLKNRAFKSKVSTAISSLKKAIETKEDEKGVKSKFNLVNSLLDKGKKRNIFKANKTSRVKSKLQKQLNARS